MNENTASSKPTGHNPNSTAKVGEIIYIGDPMCSWCWGVAPELQKLRSSYDEKLDFRLILGGLRPGSEEKVDDKMAKFLAHHWEQVHAASGQPFSHEILERRDFVYDTEPPSRAVRVIRDLAPEKEWAFFKATQRAFYAENRDTNVTETYLAICDKMDIDRKAFAVGFDSDEARQATRMDFAIAQQMGVRSFPTTVLRFGEEFHLLAMGYAKYAQMAAEIDEVLEG